MRSNARRTFRFATTVATACLAIAAAWSPARAPAQCAV